jgi:hypothetical protein
MTALNPPIRAEYERVLAPLPPRQADRRLPWPARLWPTRGCAAR